MYIIRVGKVQESRNPGRLYRTERCSVLSLRAVDIGDEDSCNTGRYLAQGWAQSKSLEDNALSRIRSSRCDDGGTLAVLGKMIR